MSFQFKSILLALLNLTFIYASPAPNHRSISEFIVDLVGLSQYHSYQRQPTIEESDKLKLFIENTGFGTCPSYTKDPESLATLVSKLPNIIKLAMSLKDTENARRIVRGVVSFLLCIPLSGEYSDTVSVAALVLAYVLFRRGFPVAGCWDIVCCVRWVGWLLDMKGENDIVEYGYAC